jgi:hypothetical protein
MLKPRQHYITYSTNGYVSPSIPMYTVCINAVNINSFVFLKTVSLVVPILYCRYLRYNPEKKYETSVLQSFLRFEYSAAALRVYKRRRV